MNDLEFGPANPSFTGVWRLESYTDSSKPPSSEAPLGAQASGILIYTADGWVSAQLTIPTRQLPGSSVDDSAPSSEDTNRSYLAYCGRYHLDLEHSEVIHVPEAASLPHLVNQRQRRRFVFVAADRLELTAERTSQDGTALGARLMWRRSTSSFHKTEGSL